MSVGALGGKNIASVLRVLLPPASTPVGGGKGQCKACFSMFQNPLISLMTRVISGNGGERGWSEGPGCGWAARRARGQLKRLPASAFSGQMQRAGRCATTLAAFACSGRAGCSELAGCRRSFCRVWSSHRSRSGLPRRLVQLQVFYLCTGSHLYLHHPT